MTAQTAKGRLPKRKSGGDLENIEYDMVLNEAVEFLTKCKEKPKLRGNIKLQVAMEKIEETANETGLPPDTITELIDVIGEGNLPESVNQRLVKHLIPETVVPSEAIIRAISWMCTNKPSSSIQSLLIRWIAMIYETISNLEDIHALYGFIFLFIQNEAMCRHVCHLLYMLTRKEDVKLFRVRLLLRLQKKMGPQPYIEGLLTLYQIYAPRYVILRRTNKIFFRQTDKAWLTRVRTVLDRRRSKLPRQLSNQAYMTLPAKRVKKELIPPTQSALVQNCDIQPQAEDLGEDEPVPFAQITSFELLLQNFDRLELPSQMAVCLKDRNLQHVLLSYPDPAIAMRLAYWLVDVLYEEFLGTPLTNQARQVELLHMLITFSEFLKESVPVCEEFLIRYLHAWDGTDYRTPVLQLITRFRLYPYNCFRDLILEPLQRLFFCSSVYFKCQVLKVLTKLLHNLVSLELPRYKYCLQKQRQQTSLTSDSATQYNSHCVFSTIVTEFCVEETLLKFTEFVGNLIDVGIIMEQGNAIFVHCALSFYEMACGLQEDYAQPFIVMPNKALVYTCLFSINASSLNRMCHLICRYRQNFVVLRNVSNSSLTEVEIYYKLSSLQKIRLLNQYILDFCDSLWRDRAFSSQETSTIYYIVKPEFLKKVNVSNYSQVFSLYRHPALIGFIRRFLDKNYEEKKMRHPSAIRHCRDEFLEYLNLDYLPGISELIMKNINRHSSSS